nr:retrovirus-related pol polyprotein from transposon tnt 1-94 [Quercus suber]
MVETQLSKRIKIFQSGNAFEYTQYTFQAILHSYGTVHQLTFPSTSQQNGRAERKLHHILDTVHALFLSAKVSAPFWGKAALHVVHAINRIPSLVIQNKTPYEHLFRLPPDYHHLRSFSFACFVLLQPHEHKKLEPQSRLCCFLGFVVFLAMAKLKRGIGVMILPLIVFVEDELPNSNPKLGSPTSAPPEDRAQDIPPHHSTRDLVTLPPGKSAVGCKWIYKIKTRSNGSIERYKARLVTKGDPTDCRSTTSYCFLLGSSLISWRNKKQTHVARFNTEAEYRALVDTTFELFWLQWLLKDLDSDIENESPPKSESYVIPSQSVPPESQPVSIQVVDSQPSSSIESRLPTETTY